MLTVGYEAKLMAAAVFRVLPVMEKKLLGFAAREYVIVSPASGSTADSVPTTALAVPSCITMWGRRTHHKNHVTDKFSTAHSAHQPRRAHKTDTHASLDTHID